MSARFFYAGKKRPRPIWGPPGHFFAWAGKIQKLQKKCLFSSVGPWALFTRFGALAAIHPRWGNRWSRLTPRNPRAIVLEKTTLSKPTGMLHHTSLSIGFVVPSRITISHKNKTYLEISDDVLGGQ